MRQEIVSIVVYFYIFICIALLVFNIAYIAYSKQHQTRNRKLINKMKKFQLQILNQNVRELTVKQKKYLVRRLKKTAGLEAFSKSLEENKKELSEEANDQYLVIGREVFVELTKIYCHRPVMERAFWASFVADYFGNVKDHFQRMGELFLFYFRDSTIYCRENVLRALYVIGKPEDIKRALQIMQAYGWYHHPRLISDGMMIFKGDKEALVRYLWSNDEWSQGIKIALIQFMTNVSDSFTDLMMNSINVEDEEVQFAAIRYFERHPSEKVKSKLIEIVESEREPAVAAVLALSVYKDEETKAVLNKAMVSFNWNIRKNAALALLKMGLSPEEEEALKNHPDRYAREMFDYVLESGGRKEGEKWPML